MLTIMKLDMEMDGWEAVFKPHEINVIRTIYDYPAGVTSSTVHNYVSEVSRATVINFMQWLAEEELVNHVERTGKGGKHGVFSPKYPRDDLGIEIINRFTNFMDKNLAEVLV